jgi:hypothetical protein
MKKVFFIALLAVVMTAAFAESDDYLPDEAPLMGNDQADMQAEELVEVADADSVAAKVETTTKAKMELGAEVRMRLDAEASGIVSKMAMKYPEMSSLIAITSFSKIAEKAKGDTGYGEMGGIMRAVDDLENKLKTEKAKDKAYIEVVRTDCEVTRKKYIAEIARAAGSIKRHAENVSIKRALIIDRNNKIHLTRVQEAKLAKALALVKMNLTEEEQGYWDRRKKRSNERVILTKALKLVCTFREFKGKHEYCIANDKKNDEDIEKGCQIKMGAVCDKQKAILGVNVKSLMDIDTDLPYKSEWECVKRARYYHEWCGFASNVIVEATFLSSSTSFKYPTESYDGWQEKRALAKAKEDDELMITEERKETVKKEIEKEETEAHEAREKIIKEGEKEAEDGAKAYFQQMIRMSAGETALLELDEKSQEALEARSTHELDELSMQSDSGPVAAIVRSVVVLARAKMLAAKKTLVDLMTDLRDRMKSEQAKEDADWKEAFAEYQGQIKSLDSQIAEQIGLRRQYLEEIVEYNESIDESNRIADQEREVVKAQKELILKKTAYCVTEEHAYRERLTIVTIELRNVDKLRSLLRELSKSQLPKCPGDCTSEKQGKCVWKGLYGKDSFCACTKEFYANDCNKKKCPGAGGVLYEKGHRGVCSRRGTCDDAADKGTCTCSAGYYHGPHNSCEYKVCPGNGNCNGRGRCDKPSGSCLCYQKYYGHDCSRTKCPATSASSYLPADNRAVCSGRGACNFKDGTCRCSSRYQGQYCQLYRCPGNCSGRGSCNVRNGTCSCRSGYHGTSCQYRTCPSNCSGRGRCNSSTGRCTCYNGGSGPACGLVHQCLHTWVNWSGTFAARGTWGECPHGKFLTGLQKLNHNVWSCKTLRKWCHRRKKVWGRTITLPYICSYRRCERVKKVCDDISCIKYAQCASPCEGGKVAPIGSCYTDNNSWWRTFDYTGWSRCRAGTFMRAMLRNTGGCAYLHCIEQVQCCSVRHAAQADCIRTNWWGCLDWNSEARCVVHGHFFVSGFYRTGTLSSSTSVSGVHNLEEAWSCRFRRTSGAPMLH